MFWVLLAVAYVAGWIWVIKETRGFKRYSSYSKESIEKRREMLEQYFSYENDANIVQDDLEIIL